MPVITREQRKMAVTMSQEQFETLMASINHRTTPARVESGNFVKCSARFNGHVSSDIDSFIDSVSVYKECALVSDENALKGLPMLLTDHAASWWTGVRHAVRTFPDAIELLKSTFGKIEPPHRVYQNIFAMCQGESQRTDLFVSQVRKLFAALPNGDLTEKVQLDMCYGLLSPKIREKVKRAEFDSFEVLLKRAREEEVFLLEVASQSSSSFKPQGKPNYCNYCKQRGHDLINCSKREKSSVNPAKPPTNLIQGRNEEIRTRNPLEFKAPIQNNPIYCYSCGTKGFIRTNCPNCTKTTAAIKREVTTVPYSSKNADKNINFDSFCIENIFMSALGADGEKLLPQTRPILNIGIFDAKGIAIIDTAAKLSIASPSLYNILKQNSCLFESHNINVKLADGSESPYEILQTNVNIELEGSSISTSLVVFPQNTNHKTLLGIDFIKCARLILDFGENSWKFQDDNKTYPLIYEDSVLPAVKPYGKENTEIRNVNQACFGVVEEDDLVDEYVPNQILGAEGPISTIDPNMLRQDEAASLSENDRQIFNQVLQSNEDIFRIGGEPTSYIEHRINTGDHLPVAVPPYPLNKAKREILSAEINKLLESDTIEECESPWAAPVVMVSKPDGSVRVCVDYRKLNAITVADKYPMPRIDNLIHMSKKSLYMSTIDLRSGYYQIAVHVDDRDKTAFTSPLGLYRFKRMPFGLRNAPATFQRLIDRLQVMLPNIMVRAYLDDIIIISESFTDHIHDLKQVFSKLRLFNLKANRNKCSFLRSEIKFLGHLLTKDGILPNLEKTEAIAKMAEPKNLRHLKTFIQTCSWYRKFIPNFADIARPLTDLTKKKSTWMWDTSQRESFEKLKQLLSSAPILNQADESKPYIVRTDASNYALGSVLLQSFDGDEKPIEYASRLLTPAERNYSTTEREALAVVWAFKKFQGYLDGSEVTVGTDHQALKWLMTIPCPTGRLARWALSIQSFNPQIIYTPGKANVIADTLSRPPCVEIDSCGICSIQLDLPTNSVSATRASQLEDEHISKIIDAFEKELPNVNTYISRGYIMEKGILYRIHPDHESDEPQLVVPQNNTLSIIREYHDAPTAGHYGVERTLSKICHKFYWTGMRRQITDYVKACQECQKYKVSNLKPSGLLQTPEMAQRFEILSLDLFGPLVESHCSYRWILIIEDTATKWVELFPLVTATAENCAKILIDEFFCRYGLPRRIISDNGSQFVSSIMQHVMYCLGIDQKLTPVYHPEANAVERKNRDLKTQLSILVQTNHSSWPEFLPAIRFAMNSTKCSSTGHTSAYLTFGRELRTLTDLQHDFRAILRNENLIPQITPHLSKLHDIMKTVRDNFEHQQDLRKFHVDNKRIDVTYDSGDLVLVKNNFQSNLEKGITSKFMPRRDGPYRVRCRKSVTSYVIENIEGTEIGVFHTSHLTPFHGDQSTAPIKPRRPLRVKDRLSKTNSSSTQEPTSDEPLVQSTSNELERVHTGSGREVRKPSRFVQ